MGQKDHRGWRGRTVAGLWLAAVLLVAAWAGTPGAALAKKPSHMDEFTVRGGCSACHRSGGVAGTPLLVTGLDDICFLCHGFLSRRGSAKNIEAELEKPSVHPIFETARYHRRGEELPETSPSTQRHVACFDCHKVHLSEPDRPWHGVRGYEAGPIRGMGPARGVRKRRAENEYELCYLCHSESLNLPADSRNVALEFDPDNLSYHPVEMEGRNSRVPSLVPMLSETSLVTCGDCHGNSDPGGPRGPHGSDYAPLLVAEYRTMDGPETAKTYELCYLCHRRNSILDDESFKRHRYHVALEDTSCHTCHASHGTAENRHLISFNEEVVFPASNTAGVSYVPGLPGSPRCFLRCHEADHDVNGVVGRAWPW